MYEYSILPFSTALSPHVFTKVTQAAVTPLRAMGIHLNTYLYDWLPVRTLGKERAAIRRWSSHTSPTSGFF